MFKYGHKLSCKCSSILLSCLKMDGNDDVDDNMISFFSSFHSFMLPTYIYIYIHSFFFDGVVVCVKLSGYKL